MLTALLYSIFALDQNVAQFAVLYGHWLYVLLFLVIFAETGLVVFPFLPGDSILFVAGTVVAVAGLDVNFLAMVLVVAAVLGDSINYGVGHYLGPKVFERPASRTLRRWIRREHLVRTQAFYARHGGITIVIGRFVPVIRTFAPFLAGVAGMRYRTFIVYNIAGAIAWIGSLVYAGYFFGNIPWVRQNLAWIVLVFVVVSLIPAASAFVRERRQPKAKDRPAGR